MGSPDKGRKPCQLVIIMKIKFAVTKLSILANRLNDLVSEMSFETEQDEGIPRHLNKSESINDLTEAIMGYMQIGDDKVQEHKAAYLKLLQEHTADLRNANSMQDRYKKRIKLLTNKLKRVSESQTKNNNYENQKN
tara:strand:+ start:103 stop:510 length:408 start_codon:yes stop_codon:yes gene_type:complete